MAYLRLFVDKKAQRQNRATLLNFRAIGKLTFKEGTLRVDDFPFILKCGWKMIMDKKCTLRSHGIGRRRGVDYSEFFKNKWN